MDSNIIGEFICNLRKENNMTQKELADMLGITDKAVSRWENGANYPDIETLEELSKIFDVTIEELLNGRRKVIDIEPQKKNRLNQFIVKKIIIAACVVACIGLVVGVGFTIKEIRNPIIEQHLTLYSADTRAVLANMNSAVDAYKPENYLLSKAKIFLNSEKKTNDIYINGQTIDNKGYYCGAIGDYSTLAYTFVYQEKEECECTNGIECPDFIELVNQLDFKKFDNSYSVSNTYSIDLNIGELDDFVLEMNDGVPFYLYSINDKAFTELNKGDTLSGRYASIELWRTYNGDGTLIANIVCDV